MEKHIRLIGLLWIVLGALTFVGGLFVFLVLFGISFIPDMGYDAPVILRAVGAGVGVFLWLLAVPKVIAGAALLRMKEWGRILTLILSFIGLLNFPLGTALSIYSLIILLKEETIQLFNEA